MWTDRPNRYHAAMGVQNLVPGRAMFLPVVLMVAISAVGARASAPPLVQTADGMIGGSARNGIEAFKGIPFAAPPLGKLRWRAPQPVKPWQGVLSATRYRAACMQRGMYPPDAPDEPISENCLYLNIWKPVSTSAAPLPVMVWIPGGGLTNGSGAVPLYAGNRLARRGVIVVTINYRLGVFGFLALPGLTAESAHHDSGDYGLLDQIAALTWIHRNIAAFGGDPDNVTVFGQSSGSIAISALTASPLARGLFQKAIGESGGLFEPMELLPRLRLSGAEQQGERFLERARSGSLAALREIPAARLLRVPFSPHIVLDGYVLARAPWKTYAEGKANTVSLLLGWNAVEGALFLAHTSLTPANYYSVLERSFPAPLVRWLAPSPGRTDASARAAAVAFSTDMRFRWDMWQWARLASAKDGDRVYLYEFTHSPPFPRGSPYYGLGATHGAELQYVFDRPDAPGEVWSPADRRLGRVMPAYWTAFARTGNPNGPGRPHWPRFEVRRPRLMRFAAVVRSENPAGIPRLRRISRAYRAARFVLNDWVLLAGAAAAAIAAAVMGVTKRKRGGYANRRGGEY